MPKRTFKDIAGHTRKRLYLSIPYVAALLTGYGLLTDSKASLWVGLVGIIIGPVQGHVAAANVPPDDGQDHGGPSSSGG